MQFESVLNGFILNFKLPADYELAELAANLQQALAKFDDPQRFAVLIDATAAINYRPVDEIRKVLPKIALWKNRIICTAVVVSNDAHFGITNQIAVYAERDGLIIQPFRNPREAENWLKLKLKEDYGHQG